MVLASVEKLLSGFGRWLALALALFAIYTAGIALFDEGTIRGGVMGMCRG